MPVCKCAGSRLVKLTWWVVFGVAVGDARGKRDVGDMQDVGDARGNWDLGDARGKRDLGDAMGKRDLGDMQDVGVIFDPNCLDLVPVVF
jgi:hypothetical protein